MKKATSIFAGLTLLFLSAYCQPQSPDTGTVNTYKIALFAPLYLDSAFVNNNYKYAKSFPRFALPGLDFILGAQIALDTLNASGTKLQVYLYDTKSTNENISSRIETHQLDSMSLLIGSVKDDEYYQLANLARKKKIPFISATYPNDGGITENPYLYIVNPTLKTHCEGIYSYLLQNHSTDNILLVRKKGNQEDRISGYFNHINKPDDNSLLTIQSLQCDSNFNAIGGKLDSIKKNIIVCGSMDEPFAAGLIESLRSAKKKNITIIGMPNWDGFKFKKNTDIPIYYTSPYYNDKQSSFSKYVEEKYFNEYKKAASDLTFKGFEAAYSMISLLIKHGNNFSKNINDSSFDVFSNYNFLPVYDKKNNLLNYNENKHLFFLMKAKGVINRVF